MNIGRTSLHLPPFRPVNPSPPQTPSVCPITFLPLDRTELFGYAFAAIFIVLIMSWHGK